MYRFFIVFFFLFALTLSGCRIQKVTGETEETVDSVSVDSVQQPMVSEQKSDTTIADNVQRTADSLQSQIDDIQHPVDSINQQSVSDSQSKTFLEDKIERSCNDSTIQDFRNNKIRYYGGAKVVYEDITIEADFIEFDFETRTVFAKGLPDSTGKIQGSPVFTEGNQRYQSESMNFNFETKKGIITKVFTEDEMGYIHGSRIKKMEDNTIHIK